MPRNYGFDPSMTPEMQQQARELQRKQAVMDALMANSMQQQPTQMAGRVAVRQSPLEGLGRVATAYMAKRGQKRIDKDYGALMGQAQQGRMDDVTRVMAAKAGTPASPAPADAVGGGPARPAQPGTMEDVTRAMLASQYPDIQAAGMQQMLAPPGAITQIKLGDRVVLMQDGKQIGEMATAASPDALLREKGASANRAFNADGTPNTAFQDYKMAERAAGRTSVSVNTAQEKEFEKELGKGQAEGLLKGQQAATEAAEMLSTINQGKKILDSGMVTGFGAETVVKFGQGLKQLGFDVGGDAVTNSQAYAANMAQNVGKIIKLFGAGTGLSNADREYAEKMAGGKITLDESALRKILDINERAANGVIARHNARAKGVKTNIPLTVETPATDGGWVIEEVP